MGRSRYCRRSVEPVQLLLFDASGLVLSADPGNEHHHPPVRWSAPWELPVPSAAMPFSVNHGDIDALGFRWANVAYTPDVKNIPADATHLS
jgi:hypothetical protein